jgi:hypothetical protein
LSKTGAAWQAVGPTSLNLSSKSKSSSKSKRYIDVWSPQIGLGPIRLVLVHHECKSRQKMDIFSISRTRLGSSNSSRLSMNSSRSLLRVDEEVSGSLEFTRWLLKPRKPLATQIQEPKMKVVPSLSTALVKLNCAIEFSGGCSMNTPT